MDRERAERITVIARKLLDIDWGDLAFAVAAGAGLARMRETTRPLLPRRADALVCLSVRSGLDLLLTELGWPAGSEVLVSAITIPDIPRILREHGLVPVPVDIDPETLALEPVALERAYSPRTRALLVAHLFGSRLALGDAVTFARARGIQLWEDCAQAFTGDDFAGDERSDIRMFSFGPIKTATALGGGVLLIADTAVRERMRARHASWPMQSTGSFLRRVAKLGLFKVLLRPSVYGVLVKVLQLTGRNHDEVVTRAGRGFVGPDFFSRIRHRPCPALVHLLERRLATYDPGRVNRRAAAGERLLGALKSVRPLGAQADNRTHWLFPLRVAEPERLMRELWRAGFDATCATSSLYALPAVSPQVPARAAENAMAGVLYVPAYAQMSRAQIDALASVLNASARPPAGESRVSPR